MTKQEIIDMMYGRGFTFNRESKSYGEPAGLHFVSEAACDRRHRNTAAIPVYRCSVYPETEEFECSYTPRYGDRLDTPKYDSVTDEEHFNEIVSKFEDELLERERTVDSMGSKEMETMVIDGRLHIQGEDGLFRRIPLSMDEARLKEDHPVYRVEDGKPIKVEPEEQDFAEAVAAIPADSAGLEQ